LAAAATFDFSNRPWEVDQKMTIDEESGEGALQAQGGRPQRDVRGPCEFSVDVDENGNQQLMWRRLYDITDHGVACIAPRTLSSQSSDSQISPAPRSSSSAQMMKELLACSALEECNFDASTHGTDPPQAQGEWPQRPPQAQSGQPQRDVRGPCEFSIDVDENGHQQLSWRRLYDSSDHGVACIAPRALSCQSSDSQISPAPRSSSSAQMMQEFLRSS